MATKKSQNDRLAFARNEVTRSKRWRSKDAGLGLDDSWKRFCDLYHGKQWGAASGTDQLIVNLVFSTVNVMVPAVAINNPRFVVNARKVEAAPNAIVTEEVLNYLWRRNDYQREVRLAVLDWILTGHGWLKVGYKSTKKPEVKAADGAPTTNDAGSASEGGDEGIDDREDVEGNVESELILNPDEDRPFLERISIFDVYCDPDARHPKEMRWIAQRTWRPVQDVQVDSRYSATQRARVSGSQWSPWDKEDGDARAGGNTTTSTTSDKPDKGALSYVEVIEFYDLKRNTVGTFAMTNDGHTGDAESGWLIKPAEIPYATGHPFVMLRNYEVPDHFYPIGDVAQIESLQLELNETRTQMLNYRKKFRRAWTYKKDSFDRDGIRALESEEDNVMIPVQGDEPLSGALQPVPAAITPPEFFDQSIMIQNDMDMVSGVSDYAKGNPQSKTRRTATEAAMIADAANARAQDRLMKVEAILAECGQRVIQLAQQYLTGTHVARIVSVPTQAWIEYDKDYIQGEFDFEVRGGSTEPQNETFRRQSALQLADVSAQFVDMGVADPQALYMKLLRDGFGEKDPQRYIQQPPPQPQAMPAGSPPMQGLPAGPPPGPPPGGGPMPGMGPEMGGMAMPAEFDPSLGPPPLDITPEMIAALLAAEGGLPPGAPGIPPDMIQL